MTVCAWVLAGVDRDQPCGSRVNLDQLKLLVNLTIREKRQNSTPKEFNWV